MPLTLVSPFTWERGFHQISQLFQVFRMTIENVVLSVTKAMVLERSRMGVSLWLT
jgi:hypothetical protein